MSDEGCDNCGEHCMDCRCHEDDGNVPIAWLAFVMTASGIIIIGCIWNLIK